MWQAGGVAVVVIVVLGWFADGPGLFASTPSPRLVHGVWGFDSAAFDATSRTQLEAVQGMPMLVAMVQKQRRDFAKAEIRLDAHTCTISGTPLDVAEAPCTYIGVSELVLQVRLEGAGKPPMQLVIDRQDPDRLGWDIMGSRLPLRRTVVAP